MNAPGGTLIDARGVSHRYGDKRALANVDLEVRSGTMVGLIGPDGVGKSTLLGLVAGALRIQEGTVRVFDGDMAEQRFRTRISPRIAYMPQGLGKNLYETLSVFENVNFFGHLFGVPREQRHQQIGRLLDATGLAPFADRPAGKLSGGMKQKLGLCCALIHAPDLLILDEPTTGVDPLSRRQFWDLIGTIRRQRPALGVLVATAYMDEAERFDWLVPMNAGEVLGSGTPADLKTRTETDSLEAAFVALLPEKERAGHHLPNIPPLGEGERNIAISARNLTKRFGHFTAVDGIDLDIRQGEIFGFLGSNGCGKTTTMKMLTGLLPISEGTARLFGQDVDAGSMSLRRRVGYMSQGFSLYEELTVRQNLDLHARLFDLPRARIASRIDQLLERFQLEGHVEQLASELPLGIRQRLSLAVAVIHEPEMLILDEPTSGVDPVARDLFWERLGELSREQGVTIFISTHFMNEAERCDRVSLMDAGHILVTDSPQVVRRDGPGETLDDAFVSLLKEASSPGEKPPEETDDGLAVNQPGEQTPVRKQHSGFSLQRLLGYSQRESLEVARDPVRLAFALLGSALLMLVLGYGISLDVEDLGFAVLDRDRSPVSRDYIENIAGSRYFSMHPDIASQAELDRRMRSGEVSLAIEIPPGFGADLKRGRSPQVAMWIDGAMPFRAETIGGYMEGMHRDYLADASLRTLGYVPTIVPVNMVSRYRFNQDFQSLHAVAPAVIPILLMFIPSILAALSVVREKELGSIVNLYASPATRLEFLLGKQVPYIVVSLASFLVLVAVTTLVFGVPIKGSLGALLLGTLLYVTVSTSLGLLVSTFTRTQVAALAGTAIITLLATVSFSGLIDPVSSLEGPGRLIGENWPATYFIDIVRGIYTKGLGLEQLSGQFWHLAAFIPVLLAASVFLLRKQGR